jgi:hypothetical protein
MFFSADFVAALPTGSGFMDLRSWFYLQLTAR